MNTTDSVITIDDNGIITLINVEQGTNKMNIVPPANYNPQMISAGANGTIWLAAVDESSNDSKDDGLPVLFYSDDMGTNWFKPGNRDFNISMTIAAVPDGSCLYIGELGNIIKIQQNGDVQSLSTQTVYNLAVNLNFDVYYVSGDINPQLGGNIIKSFPITNPSGQGPFNGKTLVGSAVAAAVNTSVFFVLNPDNAIVFANNSATYKTITDDNFAELITVSPKSGKLWAYGKTSTGANVLYAFEPTAGNSPMVKIEIDNAVISMCGYM